MNKILNSLGLTNTNAKIDDKIWIGSAYAVTDTKFLTENNIGFIVNASNRQTNMNKSKIPTIFVYDILDVDLTGQKLRAPIVEFIVDFTRKLKSVAKQIDFMINKYNVNVLVHCEAGVNRSASIIATYLKLYRGIPYDDIIEKLETANKTRNLPALNNILFRNIVKSIEHDPEPADIPSLD